METTELEDGTEMREGVENYIIVLLDTDTLDRSFYKMGPERAESVKDVNEATRLPTPELCKRAVAQILETTGKSGYNGEWYGDDVYLCEIKGEGLEVRDKLIDGDWTLLKTTSIYGKIGAILCWHYDGGNGSVRDDLGVIQSILSKLPKIVKGKLEGLSEGLLFDLWDALGMYPNRDEELEKIYKQVGAAWGEYPKKRRAARKASTQEVAA